jgi:hypothetical protein
MENLMVFKVKYYGATNTSGARVGIVSERFNQKVIIPYDYKYNTATDCAEKYLESKGFELVAKAEGKDCMYIISRTFKPLR